MITKTKITQDKNNSTVIGKKLILSTIELLVLQVLLTTIRQNESQFLVQWKISYDSFSSMICKKILYQMKMKPFTRSGKTATVSSL